MVQPAPESEHRLVTVLDAGLADWDLPVRARRTARLLQACKLLVWDAHGIA